MASHLHLMNRYVVPVTVAVTVTCICTCCHMTDSLNILSPENSAHVSLMATKFEHGSTMCCLSMDLLSGKVIFVAFVFATSTEQHAYDT
jgi:hypothetical protein